MLEERLSEKSRSFRRFAFNNTLLSKLFNYHQVRFDFFYFCFYSFSLWVTTIKLPLIFLCVQHALLLPASLYTSTFVLLLLLLLKLSRRNDKCLFLLFLYMSNIILSYLCKISSYINCDSYKNRVLYEDQKSFFFICFMLPFSILSIPPTFQL